jgi:methenyltetrahydromethanopterin cyclohydrolase|tara:strand:- start:596 stop:799 length:204 start_codon:yes stop_codon:yes gene_type:complete
MELIDTPNPNAKKLLFDQKSDDISESLEKVEGISSVFFGPGFITVTKDDDFDWREITEDILNIFDKL